MPRHRRRRRAGLVPLDGGDDAAVHGQLVLHLVADADASLPGAGACLAQRLAQTFEHQLQHAVAGGGGDRLVQVDVGGDVGLGLEGLGGRRQALPRVLAGGDVAGGGAARGQLGDLHLDELAQLEEVPDGPGVSAQGDVEEVAQRRGVDAAHHRALAGAHLDQAAGGQRPQRLADDPRRDAVMGGQLGLGGEELAGGELTGGDALAEVAEQALGEALAGKGSRLAERGGG